MGSTFHPPPDAAEAPEGATDPSSFPAELNRKDATHDPDLCRTCLQGVKPWTAERREAAASYAATSGRRIDHLPHAKRAPLEDVPTPFHPDWSKREGARV